MHELELVIIILGVLAYSLFSKRFERGIMTLPIFITSFGWLVGAGGLGLIGEHVDNATIHLLAEITLVLVLFSDASRVNLKMLLADHSIPLRMLLIGMPLTILLGALVARWVSPDAPWALALLTAAILTPTDAALGQSVVNSKHVPVRIRQAINVESGLNDGIAVPLVMIFAVLALEASGVSGGENVPDNLFVFTILQVTLGPLVGIGLGYAGAKALDFAVQRNLATTVYQGVAFLSIALLAYFTAEMVGGNGFIAAFTAGLVAGGTLKNRGEFLYEFIEGEGQVLTLITFMIFGSVMLPLGLAHATWKTVVLAILFLTVVRMLPVAIALTGLKLSLPTKLFLGWFGPRGLASVLFALLILERFALPGSEEVLACVVLTVTISIFVHGFSALPLAQRYGRYVQRKQHEAEMAHVPDELMSK